MKPEPEESDVIEEQSFDQSELKKLTEEPLRTKKVRRREKGSGRKERASIRALYLTLRVICFSNLSKGYEINQQRFSKNCYFYGTAQTLEHRIVKTVKTFGLFVKCSRQLKNGKSRRQIHSFPRMFTVPW